MFPVSIMILRDMVRHWKAVTECFHKLTGQVLSHLKDAEVEVRAYEDFASTLQTKARDGCKAPCSYLSYSSCHSSWCLWKYVNILWNLWRNHSSPKHSFSPGWFQSCSLQASVFQFHWAARKHYSPCIPCSTWQCSRFGWIFKATWICMDL